MAAPNTPKTWSSAEVVTAANMNTYVRDQQEWLLGSGTNAKPSCRVYNSANISHTTSGTWQVVTFDSERWDTGGMHSTVTNTSRITIPTGCGGKYLIGYNLGFATNTSGLRGAQVYVDGSIVIEHQLTDTVSASYSWLLSGSTLASLSAGQYIELRAWQNSGGALNIAANSNYSPEFWAIWMAS